MSTVRRFFMGIKTKFASLRQFFAPFGFCVYFYSILWYNFCMSTPYYKLSDYLKNRFGERVYKISIDGGFTCPNRDGTKGYGGCIFCNEKGSGEHTQGGDIACQVEYAVMGAKQKSKGEKFIAYFQNFSSTYAPISVLKERYVQAITHPDIVGLAIATRPDCIDDGVAKTIKEVAGDKLVWVELGLQTANDTTAKIINRGYTSSEFTKAVKVLNEYGLPVVVHLMIGLPNESEKDIERTVDFLNKHKIDGIKLHSLFVLKGTAMEKLYLDGNYTPITRDYYIKSVGYILSRVPSSVVVHRLTGDGEKSEILAPEWTKEKKKNLNAITKFMVENNITQGCFYKEK